MVGWWTEWPIAASARCCSQHRARRGLEDNRSNLRPSTLALEAIKLASHALYLRQPLPGGFWTEMGEPRKAARIIETAGEPNPHPDLAEAYVTPSARGLRARELASDPDAYRKNARANSEAALAVARAALDAQEFAIARDALAPLPDAPSKRVAILMAQLERMQQGDEGRAREWMARALTARRDPCLDRRRVRSECWLLVSPITSARCFRVGRSAKRRRARARPHRGGTKRRDIA